MSLLVVLLCGAAAVVSAEDVVVGLLALGDVQTTSQSEEVDIFSRLMYHAAQLTLQEVNDRNSTNGSLQSPVSGGVLNGSFVLRLPQNSGPSPQELAAGAEYLIGDGNSSVILGPFNVEEHDSVGFFVTVFGIPLVTVAYSDAGQPYRERLSQVAATAVRSWMVGSQVQLALQAVVQEYGWTEVGLIVGTESPWGVLAMELTARFDVQGINYTQFELEHSRFLESQLMEIKACCRSELLAIGKLCMQGIAF